MRIALAGLKAFFRVGRSGTKWDVFGVFDRLSTGVLGAEKRLAGAPLAGQGNLRSGSLLNSTDWSGRVARRREAGCCRGEASK